MSSDCVALFKEGLGLLCPFSIAVHNPDKMSSNPLSAIRLLRLCLNTHEGLLLKKEKAPVRGMFEIGKVFAKVPDPIKNVLCRAAWRRPCSVDIDKNAPVEVYDRCNEGRSAEKSGEMAVLRRVVVG